MLNVGVDVGKFSLCACMHETVFYWQVENTDKGINRILYKGDGGIVYKPIRLAKQSISISLVRLPLFRRSLDQPGYCD